MPVLKRQTSSEILKDLNLKSEAQLLKEGIHKDDVPMDTSQEFSDLCEACRKGDLRGVQEGIAKGVNINARDEFDYTPLILASLCGHYEVVLLLLESGALCERDTFSGERCLYNALTDKIRVLLLKYDYSKSTDPLQPLASHITGLLSRDVAATSDITLRCAGREWRAHKFLLAARSLFFAGLLREEKELKEWMPDESIPVESFGLVIRFLYFGDIPADLGLGPHTNEQEQRVLNGVETLAKQWEVEGLWEGLSADEDRKTKMKRQLEDVARGARELEKWFKDNVLGRRMVVDSDKVEDVHWTHDNDVFADVILSATVEDEDEEAELLQSTKGASEPDISKLSITERVRILHNGSSNGVISQTSTSSPSKKTVLYPVHKSMLLRSEYFHTMFTSPFLEAQPSHHLHIINVECPPEVLAIVLTFLYTEKAEFGLEVALDVLYAADMLLIEKLKNKAAIIIGSLGSGKANEWAGKTVKKLEEGEEEIDIVEVLKAAWLLNVQRLEEFAGRYLAYRLESYVDEPIFEELIKESAGRVKNRQATDTIELLDDIRYYLSERFRLRFEDLGLHEMGVNLAKEAGVLPKGYEKEAKRREEERKKAEKEGLKTLGGEVADDEFSSDAINYQVLLDKLDNLLEKLKLDA